MSILSKRLEKKEKKPDKKEKKMRQLQSYSKRTLFS
jgi:hypothetical protein